MSTSSSKGYQDVLVVSTKKGKISVYPSSYQATVNDKPVQLTRLEFQLLKFLVENPYAVFSRQQLLNSVWGIAPEGKTRTVDVFISRLRQKLSAPGNSVFRTVPGVGYALASAA